MARKTNDKTLLRLAIVLFFNLNSLKKHLISRLAGDDDLWAR